MREKNITDVDLVLVNFLEGEQRSAEHLARSPRGTVPVLELDDGTFITESLPIMEYLEECYPQPVMIGSTPEERARVRSMERFIDLNVLLRVIRLVHATNSPTGLPPNPGVAERERELLPEALAYVDSLVGDGPFVMGEKVTIADCTLLAAFNFANFGKLPVSDEFENLNRWFESFALRHL